MPAKGGGAVTVMLVEVVEGEPGEGGGVRVARTLGLDTVRDSNNGGTDHQAERRFYGKENLHDCVQTLLLKCHHKQHTGRLHHISV